jgi:putative acetyltransferase
MTLDEIEIRLEQPGDIDSIYTLTKEAFAPMPFADGNEQDINNRLRDLGALTISLVAIRGGRVVGHAAFSPATTEDHQSGWFGLGPVSVTKPLQRQGIGGQLIKTGFEMLRAKGAKGCIVMGDTRYYPRFGFRPAPDLAPANEPAEYFMLIAFGKAQPATSFAFHPAFYA